MFAVALLPERPLKVGDAVHLHLVSQQKRSPTDQPGCPWVGIATPLRIKGRISGERERDELEVEFVVRNEEEEDGTRRAFVRASADPRMSAAPTHLQRRLGLRRPDMCVQRRRTALNPVAERTTTDSGPVDETCDTEIVDRSWKTRVRKSDEMDRTPRRAGHESSLRGGARGSSVRGRGLTGALGMPGHGGRGRVMEDRWAGTPYAAPGPSQTLPMPWLTMSGRMEACVGKSTARSSEAPVRGPEGPVSDLGDT